MRGREIRPGRSGPRDPLELVNATGAAAKAGCGLGNDAGSLDDAERARWRARALEWSRELLALEDSRVPWRLLAGWGRDPELAGVRDEERLAKLPEAEAAAWRAFWGEVKARLARIRGGD